MSQVEKNKLRVTSNLWSGGDKYFKFFPLLGNIIAVVALAGLFCASILVFYLGASFFKENVFMMSFFLFLNFVFFLLLARVVVLMFKNRELHADYLIMMTGLIFASYQIVRDILAYG